MTRQLQAKSPHQKNQANKKPARQVFFHQNGENNFQCRSNIPTLLSFPSQTWFSFPTFVFPARLAGAILFLAPHELILLHVNEHRWQSDSVLLEIF